MKSFCLLVLLLLLNIKDICSSYSTEEGVNVKSPKKNSLEKNGGTKNENIPPVNTKEAYDGTGAGSYLYEGMDDDEIDEAIEIDFACEGEECYESMDEINKLINEKKANIKYKKNPGKPLQIIKPNVNHTELILIEENLKVLKSIDKPIAIVSVLGDMHTGKSFLLNLLNDHIISDVNKSKKTINDGFKVGNDITASTYGIWIWSEPIKVNVKKLKSIYEYINNNFTNFIKTYEYEKDEYNEEIIDLLNLYKTDDWIQEINKLDISESSEVNLILMDTQGLNSPNVNKRYDEILYALSNLISTDVIFLTMKMINNKDLEFIENITKDANLFMLRAYTRSTGSTFSINKNNFDQLLDSMKHAENNSLVLESIASKNLMWVVHDFSQRLDVRKGKLWLDILLNSDRRDLDIKYWRKIITNKSKEKYDAYTTKKKKIAYLTYPQDSLKKSVGNDETSANYKLDVLYKNIDCVLLRTMYNNKDIDFSNVNMNDLNEEYKHDITLLRYKIYLRALLYPKKIYSNMSDKSNTNPPIKEKGSSKKKKQKEKESVKKEEGEESLNEEKSEEQVKEENDSGEEVRKETTQFSNRYMSGEDVYDFITFLVKSANQNLFTNVNQFFKQFKINRAEISRNDLIFLYKKYLLQFMENEEVEFFSNINEEEEDFDKGFKFLQYLKKKDTSDSASPSGTSEEGLESVNENLVKSREKGATHRLPPLLEDIRQYEELIRKQIYSIWYKYKESDFHDEEEKEMIRDIERNMHDRIDQIKNEMLELGESNILKFCKLACEDALQIVTEDVKMKSEQYPIKQKDLLTFFESVSFNLLKFLEKKLSKNTEVLDLTYYKDPICNPLINNTFQEFHFLKKRNITLNEKKLKQFFSNAVSKAKEVFELMSNNPENLSEYFKTKSTFFLVLEKWRHEAVNTYHNMLNDFYKEEKEMSDEFQNVLETDIKILKTKAMEKWHKHCREKTNTLYHLHETNLKGNFLENFNFPLDELVLEDIYLSLKSQEEQKYIDIYCANEDSWQSEYKRFLKLSDDVYKFIKDENLKAIQVTCQQPLDELKEGIKDEIKNYYFWVSLKKTLYTRAITVLSNNIENIYLKNKRENKVQTMMGEKKVQKSSNYQRISKELMSKVINRWLNNDIYRLYYPIIKRQLIQRIVCYIGFMIILFVISLILYFKKFHISFLFLLTLAMFMIFGYSQIMACVRTFFRRFIFYIYEGIASVFGIEGAVLFSIFSISITAVYVYNRYIIKLNNTVLKKSKNVYNNTMASLNMFNSSTKDGSTVASTKSHFSKLGIPSVNIDPSIKETVYKYSNLKNTGSSYQMHPPKSTYLDPSSINSTPMYDNWGGYNNSSKLNRRTKYSDQI